MTHDEGVAVFAAAVVYAFARVDAAQGYGADDERALRVEQARRQLARTCKLDEDWGDSKEAWAALGAAMIRALYDVEEAVTG